MPSIEEVTEKLAGPLKRQLGLFAGDLQSAEDLLQETLIRISRDLPGFEERSSFKTQAFSVATRTAIDHLRKSKAGSPTVEIEDLEALPDSDELTDDRIVIDEMNSCIRQEIDRPPGDYRAAIILHDLEGLTAAKTAEIMGCSLATAKIRIRRARTRLKKILQTDCNFYHDKNQVLRCDRQSSRQEEEALDGE